MSTQTFILLTALLTTALLYLRLSKQKKSSLPLPPGPKPLPLIGNVVDLAKDSRLWLTAHKWAADYGPITYTHVFTQPLVFINDHDVAEDLMEAKGGLYADKPQLIMAGELCGCENMVAFTRYGDQSRRQRKLMLKALGSNAVKEYRPLIKLETHAFLRRVAKSPTDYISHIRRYAGGITLLTMYGYQTKSNEDPFLVLAEECVSLLANKIASGGGIWPVDIFPSLKKLPDWAPGAGFKRKAAVWKKKMESFVDLPWEYVRGQIAAGTAPPSFCTTLLSDEAKMSPQHEFDIKWTANSMYSASIDTTISAVIHLISALALHPDVLAKAQAEIDNVCGKDNRLPEFTDREHLPYIEAVLMETLRWGCTVPLSLPHRLMEDDVYKGVFLPKGSLVFANTWAMMHDPELFPNPDAFEPERWQSWLSGKPESEPEGMSDDRRKRMDPRKHVFGYGRRVCPGQHLFNESGWFLFVSILATLDIKGSPNTKLEFEGGVFRTPKPFECDIRPRSEAALRLLAESEFASA